ncbi:MAG: hypothetical protein ACSHXI_19050 [Hoeflea sp.]|uniref:hypothetical protein n=1 Tax=Hoeflea sp. TaxID=1940281 RepID=UPI003EF1BB0A
MPLINHGNRHCGLRAAKTVFKKGGGIKSDNDRHPLQPNPERTRFRLLEVARDLDVMALNWAN